MFAGATPDFLQEESPHFMILMTSVPSSPTTLHEVCTENMPAKACLLSHFFLISDGLPTHISLPLLIHSCLRSCASAPGEGHFITPQLLLGLCAL